MDENLRKLKFLIPKLEIQNTFFITWLIIMPYLAMLFYPKSIGAGMHIGPALYTIAVGFCCLIFGIIFRLFSNKKKKMAIYMSFILDVLLIFAPNFFKIYILDSNCWLIISNSIILLLHVLGTIGIMNKFKKYEEMQEIEEYDKKALLDSLICFMDLNIIIGAFLFTNLLAGEYTNIFVTIYAFFRIIVIVTGLLALISTIKEKESLVTFNIIFSTINIIFTFNIVEIGLGISHLRIINNYLDKYEEE